MAKSRQIFLLAAISFVLSPKAYAAGTCSLNSSASLVSSVLLLSTTVSQTQRQPDCEEVQIAKTCTATYYGKGDGFESGTTACGDKFRPLKENTIAIKTAKNGGFFNKSLCGKKAFVTTKDPKTGRSKTVQVTITDSGSMGGTTSKRCMDLSYRAATELGIIQRGVASNTTIKVCK